jgi:hypothetical protein
MTTTCRSFAEHPTDKERVMNQTEPPSPLPRSKTPQFLIGKDSQGHWVVQEQNGVCGGLFINRAEALRYAMFENGKQPQAVIMVPGILELNINRKAAA